MLNVKLPAAVTSSNQYSKEAKRDVTAVRSLVECLTLKNVMTTYKKEEKCMKTEVNPFSVPWTRK